MKILQIRKENFEVNTLLSKEITHIVCNNNGVAIYCGHRVVGIDIDVKDKADAWNLYNELMDAWLADSSDIVIVNMKRGKIDFVFDSIEKYGISQTDNLRINCTKNYNVSLFYRTMYQVNVEAESEDAALDKAREIAEDELNEYAKEEILDGLEEVENEITECE